MSLPRIFVTAVAFVWPAAVASAALDVGVTCWRQNLNGRTGASNDANINACVSAIPSDVTSVRYTSTDVYVRSTDVPSYAVGPFPDGNPSYPSNRDRSYRIPRSPLPQSGTHTATPLGAIGLLRNGVAVFNALDAHSYQNQNIWHQNAVVVEALGFDSALGHPAPVMNGGNCNGHPNGQYHHHQRSPSLLASLGDNGVRHSPIIGYAFDGFPIYGPYGYDTPAGGSVRRINSSYRLRNISTRTTLPNGTVLSQAQYGPAVGSQYPLGYYIEDFEYVAGLGDLDDYNGRSCVTPEYPGGIYCYFATIDSGGGAAYPYYVGPNFYGVVATDNFTTVTVPGAAVTFHPGDMNCDGTLNAADAAPLVTALIDPAGFASSGCDPLSGDLNGDGFLTAADIQAFVNVLQGYTPSALLSDSASRFTSPTAFVCPMRCEGDKTYAAAGVCPVCNMKLQDPAAHQDHSPRHGGTFFMAPDGVHHLEGTLTADREFRLYGYDEYTRPIDASALSAAGIARTVGLADDRPVALDRVAGGEYLAADIDPTVNYPIRVRLRVSFSGSHEPSVYDFEFDNPTR